MPPTLTGTSPSGTTPTSTSPAVAKKNAAAALSVPAAAGRPLADDGTDPEAVFAALQRFVEARYEDPGYRPIIDRILGLDTKEN